MTGRVTKSTGKQYDVVCEDGSTYQCTIKGKFRLQGIKTTNPVAVGDMVDFEIEEDGTGVIHHIHERRNYIIRKSVNLSKQAHIIACNVDQCLLMVTLAQPETSTGFIDRFLVTAEAYSVPVTLVFNKIDLLDDKGKSELKRLKDGYELAGYSSLDISCETGEGIHDIKHLMKGKVTMISGHSGVGKSTMTNLIQPGLELKTKEVSEYHEKGQHTTTFAEMYALDTGGYIIDTPGIKGFGLIEIEKEELSHFFPEMFSRLEDCKFHNCQHLHEPECAVRTAVEQGEIADFRYKNYVYIHDNLGEADAYRVDPYG